MLLLHSRSDNNWFSLRCAHGERGAEPVPLPSAPLRENQGHETDRFAAAQPRVKQNKRGGEMLPAPSVEEMRRTLEHKPAGIIGILFAPPYTKVASEKIAPRLGYLDERAGKYIHFFCAGYGGYGFAQDQEPIKEMRYNNGVVIPWGFSQRKFAEFINEFQEITSWRYSGEADLIVAPPDMKFKDCIVYDIESMIRDGAIDTPSRIFEAVITYARSSNGQNSIADLSDKHGVGVFSEAAANSILALVPKPFQGLWKKGLHYRTRNLSLQKL